MVSHTDVIHEFGRRREICVAATELSVEAIHLMLRAHVLREIVSISELHAATFVSGQ